MKKRKKIFWIASYPKSGNTWMRAIISSLFFSADGKFNFDLLDFIKYFDQEIHYNFIKTQNLKDYKNLNKLNVISKYWLEAQKRANVGGDFAFFKTHNTNAFIKEYNCTYANEQTTRGLIYLVRDPRDVVVSYSKHSGKKIDNIIENLKSEKSFAKPSGVNYISLLSRWDQHYLSWKNLKVPKLIIKYEEILNNNFHIIEKIINFFIINYGFKFDNINTKINNIISSTDFYSLQKLEKESGFKESTGKTIFFREGKTLQWKNILSKTQINRIEKTFKKTMIELEYL